MGNAKNTEGVILDALIIIHDMRTTQEAMKVEDNLAGEDGAGSTYLRGLRDGKIAALDEAANRIVERLREIRGGE